jgi:hypothetical protein
MNVLATSTARIVATIAATTVTIAADMTIETGTAGTTIGIGTAAIIVTTMTVTIVAMLTGLGT